MGGGGDGKGRQGGEGAAGMGGGAAGAGGDGRGGALSATGRSSCPTRGSHSQKIKVNDPWFLLTEDH